MVNTLDKIIEEKKNSLNKFKKTTTLDSLEKNIKNLNTYLNFKETIK